jgi:hypothetical protein
MDLINEMIKQLTPGRSIVLIILLVLIVVHLIRRGD